MNRRKQESLAVPLWRTRLLLALFLVAGLTLEGRLVYLQLIDGERLVSEGEDRQLRQVTISVHRAPMTDRHGEPLAVSTPVDSIWVSPREIEADMQRLDELARVLNLDPEALLRRITGNMESQFLYLKRHILPAQTAEVLALSIPGVYSQREYRRFYPDGEVAGHLIGFTDIDDVGQEGLERRFDPLLTGTAGLKRVQRDRLGRVIRDVEQVKAPEPGVTVRTSLDRRIQYLAYRELKKAVQDSGARWGAVVVLDPATGEVLALANQPPFNPNDRSERDANLYRNRAITDPFEPGSAFKPLVLAAALESGRYGAETMVDTGRGRLEIDGRLVTTDTTPLGVASVSEILARSSSVGMGLIGSDLPAEDIWRVLTDLGIGRLSGSGMIGESTGVLSNHRHWRPVEQATLAYGYYLQATSLQLARAYAAIAAEGRIPPITFEALDELPERVQAISPETAAELMAMLEAVVTEGTGGRAAIPNYRVAGKTGTAKLLEQGGYSDDRYRALFVGMAPASRPRLVAAIVIEDPRGREYYGGDIAAPVFARVVGGALRIMNVPPDDLPEAPLMSLAEAVP